MSRDYKLNKSELTRLRRQEKLYEQYLPVLKLKQEQLQIEHNRISNSIHEAKKKQQDDLRCLSPFIPLFADEQEMSLDMLIKIDQIETHSKIVAGISIKVFSNLFFKPIALPYFHTASWLVRSLPLIHTYLHSEVHLRFLQEEDRIIRRELSKAAQKVNLFDQVLIPRTKDALKQIKIALGDEQVAMVTRGKIAKAKKNFAEGIKTALIGIEEEKLFEVSP